jgi:hypothetical protein
MNECMDKRDQIQVPPFVFHVSSVAAAAAAAVAAATEREIALTLRVVAAGN